ncbi:MAG: GTP 3',8-cyclase MoaA [Verrucomicrobiota bacterium]
MTTLMDPSGRKVDYLRVSVTDRCNERCLYCMPKDFHDWLPREDILSYEELLEIVHITSSLGISRYRITGGEPLIRRGIEDFIKEMIQIPGVEHVALTTNGTRLAHLAESLYEGGLRKLNVSLDAIEPKIYNSLTGGRLDEVIDGLEYAQTLGFSIKLNTVLMRGKNEDQIMPLLDFAQEHGYILRFIELMPVSMTEMLDDSNFFPINEAKKMIERQESLDVLEHQPSFGFGPARYYSLPKRGIRVGFIGAMSDFHFCDRCNKMRLTCEGTLRPCLGNHMASDLKPSLRPKLDRQKLTQIFQETLAMKPDEHVFRDNYQPDRIMTSIGG